jgi:peptidyl-prolyl cis-trans isomerase SurA
MFRMRSVGLAVLLAGACFVLMPADIAAAQKAVSSSAQGTAPAQGTAVERIAAVVNEDVISMSDVQARVKLMLLNGGLPDTSDTRQQVLHPSLRQLVEERLQVQEAKRLKVIVTPAEIDAAINRVAEQVRMTRPLFQKFLAEHGVPLVTLSEQARAALSWQKVVARKLRPEVQIGDDEIDAVFDRIKANAGRPEYLVAEIFLAVDQPEQEDQVRRLGDRLVEEIRRGSPFPAVARQFSQGASKAAGGDLGWIQAGELGAEIDTALAGMRGGQLSAPVRTADGFHILLVRDQRATAGGATSAAGATAELKQFVMPVPPGADRAAAAARVDQVRRTFQGCADFDQKARAAGTPVPPDVGTVKIADMPAELGRLVLSLPIGEPSPALNGPDGVLVVMVCSRNAPKVGLPRREEVEQELTSNRLEMLARRYLRDLRRSAFVEYRV